MNFSFPMRELSPNSETKDSSLHIPTVGPVNWESPAQVDQQIIDAAFGKCWLCGCYGEYVASIITSFDSPLPGVSDLPSLRSPENLIFLCASCLSGMRHPIPTWAFLPANLDVYIGAEETFQRNRQRAARAGKLLHRGPLNTSRSIPYRRYQIRPGYLLTSIFVDAPTRVWSGSPLAAIIHTARALAYRERLDPVMEGGLPRDVVEKLRRLLWLFATPEPMPVVVRLVSVGVGSVGGRSRPVDGDDEGRHVPRDARRMLALKYTSPHRAPAMKRTR